MATKEDLAQKPLFVTAKQLSDSERGTVAAKPSGGTSGSSSSDLHMQTGTPAVAKEEKKEVEKVPEKKPVLPEPSVFTEFTKNKTIAIEFCISKASDIVAKHWEKTPPDAGHQTLDDKVADIEHVSDKLLSYLSRKIQEKP